MAVFATCYNTTEKKLLGAEKNTTLEKAVLVSLQFDLPCVCVCRCGLYGEWLSAIHPIENENIPIHYIDVWSLVETGTIGIQLWNRWQCRWTLYKTDKCKQVLTCFNANRLVLQQHFDTYCNNIWTTSACELDLLCPNSLAICTNHLKTVWKATSLVWLENAIPNIALPWWQDHSLCRTLKSLGVGYLKACNPQVRIQLSFCFHASIHFHSGHMMLLVCKPLVTYLILSDIELRKLTKDSKWVIKKLTPICIDIL